MRTTFTFVLYLLVDTDEPTQLRGILHPVVNDADYPFTDEQALVDLLRQITSGATATTLTGKQQEVAEHE